jgi:hypothetical protein
VACACSNPAKSDLAGVKCCFFFSLAGVVFLSTISVYLGTNSPYLVLPDKSSDKQRLLPAVVEAIFMYLACMALCAYLWYSKRKARGPRPFD